VTNARNSHLVAEISTHMGVPGQVRLCLLREVLLVQAVRANRDVGQIFDSLRPVLVGIVPQYRRQRDEVVATNP
jgi:hypothetical protein